MVNKLQTKALTVSLLLWLLMLDTGYTQLYLKYFVVPKLSVYQDSTDTLQPIRINFSSRP